MSQYELKKVSEMSQYDNNRKLVNIMESPRDRSPTKNEKSLG